MGRTRSAVRIAVDLLLLAWLLGVVFVYAALTRPPGGRAVLEHLGLGRVVLWTQATLGPYFTAKHDAP